MSFKYFDRVYCIHLPNDQRRIDIQQQFSDVGIKHVQFIHARRPRGSFRMSNMRRGPVGEFGCSLSHIKAAVRALADGTERPLFLEDDVIFAPGAKQTMLDVIDELPKDWDILYMGGHPRGPVHQVSKSLVSIGAFSFAESYAIKREALLPWIDYWCDRAGQPSAMVDIVLGEFASQHNGYCIYPTLTHQPIGVSQISGAQDDKSPCLRKGWANNLCTDDKPCADCATKSA